MTATAAQISQTLQRVNGIGPARGDAAVADWLGVPDEEIVSRYAQQGYGIIGSVERIKQWREARATKESKE